MLLSVLPAAADTLTIPNSFTDGTTASATQVNANFTAISSLVNGNVANDNIKSSAAIALSKLDLTSELMVLRSAANRCVSAGTTGDTIPRVGFDSSGRIFFGPGSASATDLLIKRTDANTLAIRNAGDSADKDLTAGAITGSGAAALNSLSLTTALPGTSGGTGNTAAPGTGKMLVSDGTKYAQVGPGTNKQIPRSDGTTIAMVTPDYVDGPASSTDKAVALFDGTTGKLLKNGIAPGTSGNVLTSDGTNWTSAAAGTSVFTSSNQTITAAGSLTLAHGLGATPKRVWAALYCNTSEHNYSVGNVVPISNTVDMSGSYSNGYMCVADATNLNIRYGVTASPFKVLDKTSGSAATCTNASWRVIFYAQ